VPAVNRRSPAAATPPAAPVAVRCERCGFESEVETRSRFGIIEDLHRDACGIDALSYQGGADAVLHLPPY
jgi:hypothetical protein